MDKWKLVFVFIVIGLFIGGCAKPQAEPEVVPEPVLEPQPVVMPEPEPVIKEVISAELQGILNNNQKVKSFMYRYTSPNTMQVTYYFKGDKIRATYSEIKDHNEFPYYHIYFNTAEETAYLACDDVMECKGKKALSVDFDEFKPEASPLEVIQALEYGEITEHTQIDNKDSAIVRYTNAMGNEERIWIWEFWGMPLQREVKVRTGTEMFYYNGLVINGVVDSDVDMPSDLELI